MPVFREYVAKGKLTPSDLGFTAMETAARRQQSFTADQQTAIEKSAKAVGQAWEGSLKFGLDEIELAQQQAAEKHNQSLQQAEQKHIQSSVQGLATTDQDVRHKEAEHQQQMSHAEQSAEDRHKTATAPKPGKEKK